jgi:TIR domain/Pentapeptide repeats (8 copies)
MANPEHLAILKQGVEQWNKWRDEHPDVAPSLSKADLSGADLRKANLGLADLGGANLSNADLRGAEFLVANLHIANLTGADFGEAWAWGTQFDDVDLSVAKSLETVKHFGPSSIGIDTIYKSHRKIPEAFLRGCGVPDDVIAYIGSMIGRPIEYHSCFISYLSEDREFAERLHADLQSKGVRCWFAPQDMHGGRTINEQIDEAIRKYDRLLLILSERSLNSDWVKTEIAKARKRETKDKKVLFPVRLVSYETMQSWEYIDSSGKDVAEEMRQYFIPDFSRWKEHDSYQAALQRLVSDLKAGQ